MNTFTKEEILNFKFHFLLMFDFLFKGQLHSSSFNKPTLGWSILKMLTSIYTMT